MASVFCGSSARAFSEHGVGVLRVERQGLLRLAGHEIRARRATPVGLVEVQPGPQVRQSAPGLGEVRRTLRGDLQQPDEGTQLIGRVGLRARAQIEIVVRRIDRPRREAGERLMEREGDVLGDLVLDGEDVLQAAVVAIRPHRGPGLRLHEARTDAHTPGRALDGAVEDV
jgi:hypothetical protein